MGIVTKTVAWCTFSGTRVRAHRGLGVRVACVTPLRVFIPGAHVPILFLALALSFGSPLAGFRKSIINGYSASIVNQFIFRVDSWSIIGISQGIQQSAGIERL